ncbi:Gfo/Idh/MocA family protein, partial [Caballeronia sp. BR00000012568055]|uniref:Gfo/Idh/MocA family protein n=1 Tax=Caballeronia sp. BR00000012568055 TaxID=2918761 RepID=UPI0023F92D9D
MMGLRWGILGAASIADSAIIPAIMANPASTVVSIASRDLDRASALARKHGVGRAESYSRMLGSGDLDAVYIPLPVASHVEWIEKALAAGKHVLCEKPIAMNADDIRQLIKLRDRFGLVCAEAMMIVHSPQWQAAMDLILRKAIGVLKRVDGCFSYYLDDPSSIRNQGSLGGGALRDIGVYPVAATRIVTR